MRHVATFFVHAIKQQKCVNRSNLSREWLVNGVHNIGVTYACETRTNTENVNFSCKSQYSAEISVLLGCYLH